MGAARARGDHDGRLDTVVQHGARVVVGLSWADEGGHRHDWAYVLELADGVIVGMQDYASPIGAAVAARVRSVFGS